MTRIVSLLPSATEIVYRLGLGDDLVGVTHECDHPAEARTKPVLTASALAHGGDAGEIDRHVRTALHRGSSLYTLDARRLAGLAPEIVVTQELCEVCAVSYAIVARAVRELPARPESGDARIVSLEPASLEDVFATIATVAELAGVPERAGPVVDELRERTRRLAAAVRGRPRIRTLLLEWTDPPFNAGHWTPELIELAGGEPLLASAGERSRALTWPEIERSDPEVVIVAPCGFDLPATRRAVDRLAERMPAWSALRAVRSGRTYALDGNAYVARPGPRLVESAELIALALHDVAMPGITALAREALVRLPATS